MSPRPEPTSRFAPILVIGYGNEQRGDDAVGALVARAVATWELPDVQAISVHQLTPELAHTLAEARAVLFIDAACCAGEADFTVQAITGLAGHEVGGHGGDPRALLALADALYQRRPPAWWLTIPAERFAFGAELSPTACRGMLLSLRFLRDLIHSLRSEPCTRSD